MQLNQLKYILEVAKTGSMNKAAQNLFLSQPNLSSAIASLESELSVTIFIRTNKGVEVTPEGNLILKYANYILGQVDQLKSMYTEDNYRKINIIEISQSKVLYLTEAIKNTYNMFSSGTTKFKFKMSSISEIIDDVYNMKSEVGFVVYSTVHENVLNKIFDHKKLEFFKICESNLCLITSETNTISSKKSVDIEELTNSLYIGYFDENTTTIRYSIELSDKAQSNLYKHSINVTDSATLQDLLHSMDGYSFDLLVNADYLAKRNIKSIKLKDEFSFNIGWIKRKKDSISYETKLFIDEVTRIYGYN